jgi:hypothetical protein
MINGLLFKFRLLLRKLVIISVTVLMAQTASAQTKYNTWSDPSAPKPTSSQNSGNLQKLIDELNKMVGEAERDRAAAPAFLRDLRDLTRRYDVPWRVDLVNETFSDGDFTANPVWQVSSGRWWVEKGFGLRAAFENTTSQPQSSSDSQQKSQGNDDLGKQLLGAILNQALGGNQQNRSNGGGGSTSSSTQSSNSKLAAIHLDRSISNAFSLQLEFTSWRKDSSLEIMTFQGNERKMGYRLLYRPGNSTGLEIGRTSRFGSNTIQNYRQSLDLEDKSTHMLLWNRDRVGNMTVSLDGKQLMAVTDQSFQDPFSGLSLINHNGDFIISKVALKGTN